MCFAAFTDSRNQDADQRTIRASWGIINGKDP